MSNNERPSRYGAARASKDVIVTGVMIGREQTV